MTNITPQTLHKIVIKTGLDSIIHFDASGELLHSIDFEYDANYAAMGGLIITMCKEMIAELQYGELEKLMIYGVNGMVLMTKVDKDTFLAAFTKDISKLGILTKTIETILEN